MNKKTLIFFFTIVAGMSIINHESYASESNKQWTITPRFWSSNYEDVMAFQIGQPYMGKTSTLEMGFYGLTVRYSPAKISNYEFILSGYIGNGKCDYIQITANAPYQEGKIDVKREDWELLVRHNLWKNSRAYLLYGYRWIHIEDELRFIIPASFTFNGEYEYNIFELGYGFSAPVNESGTVNAFSNIVIGFGQFVHEQDSIKDVDEQSSLLDLNIGMQWAATESLSFHARYRNVQMGYDFTFNNSHRVSFIHGFEVGTSFSF